RTVFGTYGGEEYAPSNYDGSSHGPVSMRKALAGSLNVPAVKTLALAGVQNAIDTMKDMGLTSTPLNTDVCGLSLVLGGCELTLLDHTSAMGTFAALGKHYDHTPILSVTDAKGKILEEFKESEGKEVLDPQVAYEIVSIMTDNDARAFVFGSRSPLILPDRPVGAKTGTTQKWKDGWTMGYTPSLVTGVWTGNNDSTPMRAGADGVVVAAPIWNQFMREATKGTPIENFVEPPGIQNIYVDAVSGKLPTEYTPTTKSEVFADFAVPKDYDDVHVVVRVNRINGKRASDLTPPDLIENRVFTIFHSEQRDNPNWENPVQAWARAAGYNSPPTELDDGSGVDPNQVGGTQVRFIKPNNNSDIKDLPFTAEIQVIGQRPDRVELYLEGDYVGRQNSEPYLFTINDAEEGWQTLMVNVTMPSGDSIQNSIRIFIDADDDVTILNNSNIVTSSESDTRNIRVKRNPRKTR
ncbi:MAG TPA: penicillin-binding transpeptidase domain-containing protein, partial [Verrucomicrobiae bacterium]|nr:penicillin-binding transpeptidase domain-containing protein [Verrucomicrobiae bacterium]